MSIADAGMTCAFAGYFGGFGAFVLVAALGAIGYLAGRFADGNLDPADFIRSRVLERDRDRDRRR